MTYATVVYGMYKTTGIVNYPTDETPLMYLYSSAPGEPFFSRSNGEWIPVVYWNLKDYLVKMTEEEMTEFELQIALGTIRDPKMQVAAWFNFTPFAMSKLKFRYYKYKPFLE